MKKTFKRTLSIALCLVMLLSTGAAAFAGNTPPTYQKFDSVFAIGDSNTMAYGLPGYKGNPAARHADDFNSANNWTENEYLHGIDGSYPQLVSEALGLDNTVACDVMAYPAFRAKDMLYFLGGDVDMSNDSFFQGYVTRSDGWCDSILKDICSSREQPYNPYFTDILSSKNDGENLILVYAGASDVFFSSLSGVDLSGDIGDAILGFVKTMWNNYWEFLDTFPALMDRLLKLNPNATIVIIGTFNPVKDLKISEDIWLPVLDAMSAITGLMNKNYQAWAEEYGCLYADISNVETATLEQGLTVAKMFSGDDPELIYHATPEGYKYIARQILRELELDQTVSTDISIDLGSVKDVSSVTVGGKIVKDYSFNSETHTLTVPYDSKDVKLVTVTEKRENGTYLATYQLSWSDDDGYTAYRMIASRNVFETVTTILNPFLSFFKSIFSIFTGFFK